MNDESESKSEGRCRKVIEDVKDWLALKNEDKWVKDMRGNLTLVATVIATMTFPNVINPPGGVRPADVSGKVVCPNTESNTIPCPGVSVLTVVFPFEYDTFLLCNTICFVSSLAVCLLHVSGLPLNNRFLTWLLSMAMCITLTSLTLTYLFGALMVSPQSIWRDSVFNINMVGIVLFIWIFLVGLVTLLLFLRLIVWIVIKFIDTRKR